MSETFDVLIVGGGSASAVLANRLSEGGTRRVMLLEAGSAYSANLYPPDLANADILGGLTATTGVTLVPQASATVQSEPSGARPLAAVRP